MLGALPAAVRRQAHDCQTIGQDSAARSTCSRCDSASWHGGVMLEQAWADTSACPSCKPCGSLSPRLTVSLTVVCCLCRLCSQRGWCQAHTHPCQRYLLFGGWEPYTLLCSREPARGRVMDHGHTRGMAPLLPAHSTQHWRQRRHHDSGGCRRCCLAKTHGRERPPTGQHTGATRQGHTGQWRVLEVRARPMPMQQLLGSSCSGCQPHVLHQQQAWPGGKFCCLRAPQAVRAHYLTC